MENNCPFCGADYDERITLEPQRGYVDIWDCGTEKLSDREIERSSQCYETELSALKSLVREMGEALDAKRLDYYQTVPQASVQEIVTTILRRPEVKALLMPHEP